MSLISTSRSLIVFALLPAAFSTVSWSAATLTVPAQTTLVGYTTGACNNLAGNPIGNPCSDTSYLSSTMANWNTTFISPTTFNGVQPTNQTFQTAFANGAAGWNLINGGTLDLTINVPAASYFVNPNVDGNNIVGGMNIIATVAMNAGYTGPSLAQLVWTQALYINYTPTGAASPANPAVTLDTYALSGGNGKVQGNGKGPFNNPATPIPPSPPCNSSVPGQCTPSSIPNNITGNNNTQRSYNGPIYPFQGVGAGTNKSFGDAPAGYYQTPASFRGIALLTTVDTVTHTITVYNDGISYGFDLATPEPLLTIPVAVLFAFLLSVRNKRRRAAVPSAT